MPAETPPIEEKLSGLHLAPALISLAAGVMDAIPSAFKLKRESGSYSAKNLLLFFPLAKMTSKACDLDEHYDAIQKAGYKIIQVDNRIESRLETDKDTLVDESNELSSNPIFTALYTKMIEGMLVEESMINKRHTDPTLTQIKNLDVETDITSMLEAKILSNGIYIMTFLLAEALGESAETWDDSLRSLSFKVNEALRWATDLFSFKKDIQKGPLHDNVILYYKELSECTYKEAVTYALTQIDTLKQSIDSNEDSGLKTEEFIRAWLNSVINLFGQLISKEKTTEIAKRYDASGH